jgi:hypothetical protein
VATVSLMKDMDKNNTTSPIFHCILQYFSSNNTTLMSKAEGEGLRGPFFHLVLSWRLVDHSIPFCHLMPLPPRHFPISTSMVPTRSLRQLIQFLLSPKTTCSFSILMCDVSTLLLLQFHPTAVIYPSPSLCSI